MSRERFESAYQGQAPWDIGGPQPEFVKLEASGELAGTILDVGCGTGENALFLASRGHSVWGVDFVPMAIERAQAKAQQRGLKVPFLVLNALELEQLGRSFDTIIDCGLFHTFNDEERPKYVASLARAVHPEGRVHLLCFSDQEPPGEGPRRITSQELHEAFRDGWIVETIREARFETTPESAHWFSPGGPRAWLATIRRTSNEGSQSLPTPEP